MSRRIDIELTSALSDGSWTWRAAGAKQPKGVLDGSVLPSGAKVGDELKVEVDQQLDGITVLSVVGGRERHDRTDTLELLPSEREFKPVVETRAKRERGERRGDGRGERRSRGGDRRGRGGDDERGGRRRDRSKRGPSFTPPPEVPQRPKPKRLRPGKAHRNAVLDELPEEQRAIAELAVQGMPAVRQRLREENERAVAEGRPVMPEASVLKLAEELLPRLRVAEWLDRAEAAQRQMDALDLRDLRSVVAAAGDPVVARDETARPLIEQMQAALATKQEQELQLWFGDVDAALAVGRVVRALRLSSQPPKAGVPFPADIAQRLVDSANASLAPMDSPDRWIAMLEAAAFSPIRSQIRPARKPDVVNDDLMTTVRRLAPALPQVAELFEVEVAPDAPMPKPLRPGPGRKGKKAAAKGNKPPTKDSARGGAKPKARKATRDEQAGSGRQPTKASPADSSAGQPAADAPATDTPATAASDEPATAAPAATEPATEAAGDEPTTAEPATEAAADETTVAEPATEAAADETTAEAPAPATDEPTAEAPAPTADEPTTDPATDVPAAESAAAGEPAAATAPSGPTPDAAGTEAAQNQPAVAAPATEAATDERTTATPTEPATEAAADEPTTAAPAEAAADEPTTATPAEAASDEPTTAAPAEAASDERDAAAASNDSDGERADSI